MTLNESQVSVEFSNQGSILNGIASQNFMGNFTKTVLEIV